MNVFHVPPTALLGHMLPTGFILCPLSSLRCAREMVLLQVELRGDRDQ